MTKERFVRDGRMQKNLLATPKSASQKTNTKLVVTPKPAQKGGLTLQTPLLIKSVCVRGKMMGDPRIEPGFVRNMIWSHRGSLDPVL